MGIDDEAERQEWSDDDVAETNTAVWEYCSGCNRLLARDPQALAPYLHLEWRSGRRNLEYDRIASMLNMPTEHFIMTQTDQELIDVVPVPVPRRSRHTNEESPKRTNIYMLLMVSQISCSMHAGSQPPLKKYAGCLHDGCR